MEEIKIKQRKPSEIVQTHIDYFKVILEARGYDINTDNANLAAAEMGIMRIVKKLEESQCKCGE